MDILISDVWSIYNAGDRAILEALVDGLRERFPGCRLTVAAHFTEGCAAIGGVEVIADVLAFDEAALRAQREARRGSDARIDRLRDAYGKSDLVVSTGGYFLNAVPDNPFAFVFLSRLLHFGWALDAGVPVAVVGQSVGPIEGPVLQAAARAAFARIGAIGVRDVQSLSFLHQSGLAPQARFTADLAVSLQAAPQAEVDAAMARLGLPHGAFGISVRRYPGTPANAFRDVARAADQVIRRHRLPVLLIGTTVPPDHLPVVQERERALGNDDSLALREVHGLMEEKGRAVVCGESLPPRLLKRVLGTCRAFLGTRMHATILATTAGVPSAGIAYEYKVRGWFEQLGLPELVLPLAEVQEAKLSRLAEELLAGSEAIAARLQRAIPWVQGKSRLNFDALEALVAASRATSRPAPQPASPAAPLEQGDPRRAWEAESQHYDVLHRRLRRIVESAERHPGTRLLDVGCSAGTVGAALSPRWTYHGCDVSQAAIATARRGWLVACDLERGLPEFDGEPYDVIVASGIFEYLESAPALLREIRRRLAPGGTLIASYFNMRHASRRGGAAFRHPLWRNDWSPAEFRALLAAAGFAVEETGWSTAGTGPAPDVRGEEQAIAAEPAIGLAEADELAHTLIYRCRAAAGPAQTQRCGPAASVVIPAFNRLDLLRPVLEGFAAQAAPGGLEVIVVDDGSEPPVAPLLEAIGAPPWMRALRHPRNAGRAAALNTGLEAASGEVVIFCDSDIVPEPGFVEEHLAFHRAHPDERATHLGALEWGVEPGCLGALFGARANPRLASGTGPVGWTQWFTDNWSFKRRLLADRGLRFDPAFRAWGWEELELAFRLRAIGATNERTGAARGRHLKPIALDGLIGNFARSVPNLLHLARATGRGPEVDQWTALRFGQPLAQPVHERIARAMVARVEALWAQAPAPSPALPGALREKLAVDLSDLVFAAGIARGFAALPPEAQAGPLAPPAGDLELLLRLGEPLSSVLLAGCALGDVAGSRELLVESVRAISAIAPGDGVLGAFLTRVCLGLAQRGAGEPTIQALLGIAPAAPAPAPAPAPEAAPAKGARHDRRAPAFHRRGARAGNWRR